MIDFFAHELSYFQVVMYVYLFAYGLSFGISNTVKRAASVFYKNARYAQSDYGKLLDSVWYAVIILAIGYNWA